MRAKKGRKPAAATLACTGAVRRRHAIDDFESRLGREAAGLGGGGGGGNPADSVKGARALFV